MNNYLITIQYDGLGYKGFQRLKDNNKTIQGILEEAICDFTRENIKISGAGRTDAGVSAYGQTASFKCNSLLKENEFAASINDRIPADIRIVSCRKVKESFHARYSAVGKVYRYRLYCGEVRDPFYWKYVYEVENNIDIQKMQECAGLIIGTHDFFGMSSDKKADKDTVRTIDNIEIVRKKDIIDIFVTGDGFLYNMVRIISGTILEYARGKISAKDVEKCLKTRERSYAGITLPPNALTLVKIFYKKS